MKRIQVIGTIALLAAWVVLPLAAQEALPVKSAAPAVKLQGAGATLPAPLYEKWIAVYRQAHPEVTISYDAVGSGEGIRRFIAGTVDFGASDSAMQDSEIAQVSRGVRLVPATAGMVVLAYNLPGLKGELKLKRDVYLDIFAGKIRDWDDLRIKASNPNLALPHKTIAVVVRQDSSGTTYAFTNHLSAISPEWRDRGPGGGKVIGWPGGAMVARGNEGVASRIKISDSSIGYLEYGFAKRLDLPMAALENKAGRFVQPDAQSGQQALLNGSAAAPDSLGMFLPDPDGEMAYPIVTYSWLLLYEQYSDAAKLAALKDFVTWGLSDGQRDSAELGYIPLPSAIAAQALKQLDGLHP
ncbi:MAG: phosphate ABC transporter substrate-binding protein PstS [Candidatus Competibacteraceae bacterium]